MKKLPRSRGAIALGLLMIAAVHIGCGDDDLRCRPFDASVDLPFLDARGSGGADGTGGSGGAGGGDGDDAGMGQDGSSD